MKQYIDLIILIFAFITGFVISIYLIGCYLKLISKKIAFQVMIPTSLFALMVSFSGYFPKWLFIIGIIVYWVWFLFMLTQYDPEVGEFKQQIKAKFKKL